MKSGKAKTHNEDVEELLNRAVALIEQALENKAQPNQLVNAAHNLTRGKAKEAVSDDDGPK